MDKPFAVSVIAAFLALACASIAFAQETKYPDILDAKPMFNSRTEPYGVGPEHTGHRFHPVEWQLQGPPRLHCQTTPWLAPILL